MKYSKIDLKLSRKNNKLTRDYINANVGNLIEVETINRRYAEYRKITRKAEPYIEGYGAKQESLSYSISEPSILLSLVNLLHGCSLPRPIPAKRIPYIDDTYTKTPPPQIFPDKWLAEAIPLEEINKWIKKYGLPYAEDSVESGGHGVLRVARFRQHIAILYSYFVVWLATLDSALGHKLDTEMVLLGLDPGVYPDEHTKMNVSKQMLAWLLSERSETKLELLYDKKSDRFSLKLTADSLLDVCYFQLASLITNKADPKEIKNHLKTCDNRACKALFWGHGNQGYCGNPTTCNPKTIWSRNQKEKPNNAGRTGNART